MSSNLPPGVTDSDIERAFGDRPSLFERFESYVNQEGGKMGRSADGPYGSKTPEEHQLFDHVYNYRVHVPDLAAFVERAMAWAYEQGREDRVGWEGP